MKKDFDFDDIGKRTPYTTPDGFFEDVQRKVMERTGVKQQRKSDYFYGSCHSGSINWNFIRSVLASNG